nr:hypothetical protein [Paramuribaculum intestinale]
MKCPSAVTASYVTAVPASTTSNGLPANDAQAPTAAAMRSVPSVHGVR